MMVKAQRKISRLAFSCCIKVTSQASLSSVPYLMRKTTMVLCYVESMLHSNSSIAWQIFWNQILSAVPRWQPLLCRTSVWKTFKRRKWTNWGNGRKQIIPFTHVPRHANAPNSSISHTLNIPVTTNLRQQCVSACVASRSCIVARNQQHDFRERKVLQSHSTANKPSEFHLIMCVRFIPNDLKN